MSAAVKARQTSETGGFAKPAPARLLAASTSAVPSGLCGDDGALLSAFANYQALKAEERALEDKVEPAFGTQEAKAREACFETLLEKQLTAIETIITSRARTSAGLRAKAQMVGQTLPNAVRSFDLNLGTDEIRLALSLAADLAGEAD